MDDDFNDEGFTHSTLESGYDFFIRDRWKHEHHFRIASFPGPGMITEAVEVTKDGSPGYRFEILSDFDTDIDEAEDEMKILIKKNVNKRHLGWHRGRPEMDTDRIIEGRIETNSDDTISEFDRLFIIDGKEITIEDFVRMLEPYEGWGIQFQIVSLIKDLRVIDKI